MARSRRRKKLPEGLFDAEITSVGHDGRGMAHVDDKATFIYGALLGEKVKFRYLSRKRSHDEGQAEEIIEASADRVEPKCEHYGLCGGCSLQHLDAKKQIESKQSILIDNLRQIGKLEVENIFPPLVNEQPWHYRRKARLGIKHVFKKEKVLVGFRERGTSFVADISHCHVLHPRVGSILPEMSAMVESLSISDRVPQVEMAMDDDHCVLIFRVLEALTTKDKQILLAFGKAHNIEPYIQTGGPTTVEPLDGKGINLSYDLPSQDVRIGFLPGDFTQVNTDINRQMIDRAIEMLVPSKDDRILDLFCGVGNFTLPLARHAGHVTGVEGDDGLVLRAKQNARLNELENTDFFTANLYDELGKADWLKQKFNKALLDPPRSGAQQVLSLLPKLGVDTILYVSCYPGTLARDAGELVQQHGYKLVGAGVMDMFPHTAHVESIALFTR